MGSPGFPDPYFEGDTVLGGVEGLVCLWKSSFILFFPPSHQKHRCHMAVFPAAHLSVNSNLGGCQPSLWQGSNFMLVSMPHGNPEKQMCVSDSFLSTLPGTLSWFVCYLWKYVLHFLGCTGVCMVILEQFVYFPGKKKSHRALKIS